MAAILMPNGRHKYFANDGTPLAGGKVYTYEAGTNTPKTTWADEAGTIPNANPVILDSRGEAFIRWDGAYKVNVTDAADVPMPGWPVDDFKSDPYGIVSGLAGVLAALNSFIVQLASSTGSSLVGFLQAGVGAVLGTVQSELRDTLKPAQFGATGDGVTDDTLAFTRTRDRAATVKGRVVVKAGTYRIQPGTELAANDTEWHFEAGAVLKLVDAQATTSFITFTNPVNQRVFGMRVDGNRAVQNPVTFGQDNCAVLVVNASNCRFEGGEIISSPAKGFGLVSAAGITTKNVQISDFVGADCNAQVLIVDGNNMLGFFERIIIDGVRIGTTSHAGIALNDGASNISLSNVISDTQNNVHDAVSVRDSFDIQLSNIRGRRARNGIGLERLNGYTGRIQLDNVVGEFCNQNGVLLLGAEDVFGGVVVGRNNNGAGINIAQTGALYRCKRVVIDSPAGFDDQGVPTQDFGVLVQGVDTCRLGPHIAYGNTNRNLSINRAVCTDVKADTRQIASASTGSVPPSGQVTVTVNWPTAFEDASIELEAPWLFEATGVTALAVSHVLAITQTVVQVQVYNRSGTTNHTATLSLAGSRTP